ncbi:MAG: hypothetical protein LBK60_04535 [Verrucomicrobiales bacterium]|jgi:hypothetical protein|nr:hypothetical protein [Verrucomicrobiales bacterium]
MKLHLSPLFTPWTDPVSGVTSYLLAPAAAAPFQQSFYYVNPSVSADGRYYWFYCAFPPAGNHNHGRSLAVADFAAGQIRHFPETQFLDASPAVDPLSGEVYWCCGTEVWRRGPGADDAPVFINRLPDAITRHRRPWRVATHLTMSADRQCLNLDALVGIDCYIGVIPLDGTPVRVWQQFDRCYNHGQFSPVDPDLQLIAQDSATNPATGATRGIDNRLWLIRAGAPAYPLLPASGSGMQGHEWWGGSGERVWYIHYHQGVKFITISDARPGMTDDPPATLVWPSANISHAHTDTRERYLVADFLPPLEPTSQVIFRDRATGGECIIVNFMPYLAPGLNAYHLHPHPQFCLNDEYICYTTLVRGRADVAFVPVADLLERLGLPATKEESPPPRQPSPSSPTSPPPLPTDANSPSVKGCPRSGRGSSAFGAAALGTLNYPVGSRRHPFTEGEFAHAGALVVSGAFTRPRTKPFPPFSRASDSPSVKGWRR